jgi:hypothetical protein
LGGFWVDENSSILCSVSAEGVVGGIQHTRIQILQLHSWIYSLPSGSGASVISAMVILPQWQPPV